MPIAEDEQLLAYYFAPKGWWVMHHLKKSVNENLVGNEEKLVVVGFKSTCALAYFKEPQQQ
jgi:hypothetical protein